MILITGHMGFIGGYLVKRMNETYWRGIDLKAQEDILYCTLPDADVVIHLAAEPGVIASMEDPYKNAMTNIMGTIRLAKRYPDTKFIFASSGGTIQETIISPYGLSKKTCEEYIKMLCNNYVILRFPNVYGKGSRSVVDKFIQEPGEVTIFGDGSASRTYGYVDDIVEAIIMAINWDVGTYKLGDTRNYTVQQIADAVGKPIRYAPPRPGELDYSFLPNVTPGWKQTHDLMNYIKTVKDETH
jgi:UDP-glucose 4-epimerase